MADPFDDIFAWLNMTPAEPKPLNLAERQDLTSRLIPFQPRVPIDDELAAQQLDREEAQRAEERLALEREAAQAEDDAFLEWESAFYEANTQGPDGWKPGALNNTGRDYADRVQEANAAKKRNDQAEMAGRPIPVQI